jgi:hypothetical protein
MTTKKPGNKVYIKSPNKQPNSMCYFCFQIVNYDEWMKFIFQIYVSTGSALFVVIIATTKKPGNKVYIKSPNKQPNSIMAI